MLGFVTSKFHSLAPGPELMQIHFFPPNWKEVIRGLCNARLLRSNKQQFV